MENTVTNIDDKIVIINQINIDDELDRICIVKNVYKNGSVKYIGKLKIKDIEKEFEAESTVTKEFLKENSSKADIEYAEDFAVEYIRTTIHRNLTKYIEKTKSIFNIKDMEIDD